MATKPKSRTSKSNLNKKAHVPIWAIALGLVVLVGLGAFFVFSSFASHSDSGKTLIACKKGKCYRRCRIGSTSDCYIRLASGYVDQKRFVRSNIECPTKEEYAPWDNKPNYLCLSPPPNNTQ